MQDIRHIMVLWGMYHKIHALTLTAKTLELRLHQIIVEMSY